MAGTTLAQAEEMLEAARKALLAVLERGQSYTIEGRGQQRAELAAAQKVYDHWEAKVQELSRGSEGGARVRRIVEEAK